jgi:hypothetical protein
VAQPREAGDESGEHQRRAVAILDIRRVDHGMDQIALGIGEDMAFAPLDLLARVVTSGVPGLCSPHALLSITPALEDASRSDCSRESISRAWLSVCHRPLSRHR